ncbi:hypothetical protein FVE85_9876 [Porphyridium purpureum]|uniref:Uncharacterized protein n=1 Tax=Porphyridium purpureum TaxID=35688 RepID=A0A5J4YJL2_PORPP|nr:hypothetical protein FVE85_9876 [Porphyridium purpureum]|eukprot:POR1158..scf289_17
MRERLDLAARFDRSTNAGAAQAGCNFAAARSQAHVKRAQGPMVCSDCAEVEEIRNVVRCLRDRQAHGIAVHCCSQHAKVRTGQLLLKLEFAEYGRADGAISLSSSSSSSSSNSCSLFMELDTSGFENYEKATSRLRAQTVGVRVQANAIKEELHTAAAEFNRLRHGTQCSGRSAIHGAGSAELSVKNCCSMVFNIRKAETGALAMDREEANDGIGFFRAG